MVRRTFEQLKQLREALLGIDQLRNPDYRNLYVSLWEQRTGASVSRFSDARHDLASLVRSADQVPDGMRVLADVIVDELGDQYWSVVDFVDLVDGETRTYTPPPRRERTSGRVFASYSRDDDQVTYGRVSTLIRDLDATYRNAVGVNAGIFKDDVSVQLGEDWRIAIANAGRSATILLAFLSPAYLRSDWCRREATDFLDRAGPGTLLPLFFCDRAQLTDQFENDALWRRLDRLQGLSIDDLRRTDPGAGLWLQALDRIAGRIAELLNP